MSTAQKGKDNPNYESLDAYFPLDLSIRNPLQVLIIEKGGVTKKDT